MFYEENNAKRYVYEENNAKRYVYEENNAKRYVKKNLTNLSDFSLFQSLF